MTLSNLLKIGLTGLAMAALPQTALAGCGMAMGCGVTVMPSAVVTTYAPPPVIMTRTVTTWTPPVVITRPVCTVNCAPRVIVAPVVASGCISPCGTIVAAPRVVYQSPIILPAPRIIRVVRPIIPVQPVIVRAPCLSACGIY